MLRKSLLALDKVINPVTSAINRIGAILLVVMAFTIAIDVFLRFFINLPLLSAVSYEIVELLLALVIFTSLAYAGVTKRHVTIDAVIDRLFPPARAVFKVTGLVVSLVLVAIITWQVTVHGLHFWKEGQTFAAFPLQVYPFILVGAFCFSLLFLVLFRNLLNTLLESRDRSPRWLMILAAIAPLLVGILVWVFLQQPLEIDARTIGLLGMAAMIVLLFSGMYLALVILLVGFLGMACVSGVSDGLAIIEHVPFTTVSSYPFSVIPLFILMGEFAFAGGMTQDLYQAAHKWFGRLPGGLAITTIAACAGFSACSGSSIATAATMGETALPEMKKYGYDNKLATGCLAAGGTLGILIPPSTIFVIYGILSQASIGKLFIAGILPGIMLASLFMLSIYVRVKHNPKLGPPGPGCSFTEKILSLKSAWPVLFLFLLVIGGIYSGVFTPNEAAGVGAVLALVFALARRRLTRQSFWRSVVETSQITAMLFLIIIGANIFGYFMVVSRIPTYLAEILAALSVPVSIILLGILIVFFFFGCIGEVITMMIIAVPIMLPTLEALGVNIIHFGVLMVMIIETGAISPPVGMNVFVIKSVAKDVSLGDIYRGIVPFLLVQLLCILLILFIPQIPLFLLQVLK